MARSSIPWLVLVAMVLGTGRAAGPADSAGEAKPADDDAQVRPVVHVLAPSAEYASSCDPLVAEAALRLVSAELAARHGLFARYWSVNELDRVPADAYPRVEVGYWPWVLRTDHVRLERRGNVFTFLCCKDGKDWVALGRSVQEMPQRTYVGLAVSANPERRPLIGAFADVRLNGAPVSKFERAEIGEVLKPGEVEEKDGEWIIRTSGTRSRRDFSGSGTFLYQPVEGDFTIQAHVTQATSTRLWKFMGVACRSGLNRDDPWVGTCSDRTGSEGDAKVPFDPRLRSHKTRVDGVSYATVTLRRGPTEAKELGRLPVEVYSWPHVTASAVGLADRIEAALREELGQKMAAPAKAVAATEAQAAALTEVWRAVFSMDPGRALNAAPQVESVLNQSPTCAEAHRTAALCAALLALQDPPGFFQQRGRFLGGALASWLLAERLAPARTAQESLAGGWLMLACGYPNSALETVRGLEEGARGNPEARALETYCTRDYRPWTPETILTATPAEQLAWTWASWRCGRREFVQDLSVQLALTHQAPGFLLPLAAYVGLGPGHTATPLGIGLVSARIISDFLGTGALPRPTRLLLTEKLATALALPEGSQPADLLAEVSRRLGQEGLDRNVAGMLQGLLEVLDTACRGAAGPVVAGEPLRWRVVPVAEAADLYRGLLIRALQRRAFFLGRMLGAPEAAAAFCRQASEGCASIPWVSAYFKALGQRYLHDREAWTTFEPVLKAEQTHTAATMNALLDGWAMSAEQQDKAYYAIWMPARGIWDWMEAGTAAEHFSSDAGRRHVVAGLWIGVDDYADRIAIPWLRLGRDLEVVTELRARMPYNLLLLEQLAFAADNQGRFDVAADTYAAALKLAPGSLSIYSTLANAHARKGDRAKAIEVGIEGAEKCEPSVSRSNLMGTVSNWLREEKRLDEALEWGRRAAGSYSYTGLKALADAQEAKGLLDDARKTFRAVSHRYDSASGEIIRFLFRHGATKEDLHREIEQLLATHEQVRDVASRAIVFAFVYEERTEPLREAFNGPLAFVSAPDQAGYLQCSTLYARDFAQAVAYGKQMVALRPPQPIEVLTQYGALCLAKDEAGLAAIRPEIQRRVQDRFFSPHFRWLWGQWTFEEVLDASWHPEHFVLAHWLKGVEAEVKGDVAGAVEAYCAAYRTRSSFSLFVRWASGHWADRLGPTTSAPASAPASEIAAPPASGAD